MNRLLMPESAVLPKTRSTKSKRVLQVLQVSATDKELLVSPRLMSGKDKKSELSQKKTEVSEGSILSKENTPVKPTVRRSKRKNAVVEDQAKKATTSKEGTDSKPSSTKVTKATTSKEGTDSKPSSTKVTKATKSKKASTRKSKKDVSSDKKQSKIVSSDKKQSKIVSSIPNCSTIFESSLENKESFLHNVLDVPLQQSKSSVDVTENPGTSMRDSKDSGIDVSLNMLVSDNPPDNYWKLLAEERRVALEASLIENEQLYDQVQVLETENSQLKGCLQEAEKLATILRQALEE